MIYSARRRHLCFGRGPIVADTESEMGLKDLEQAIQHLRNGGVVAIPTDTLYALAADVFNTAALDRIFAIKGRSDDLALPVLVSGWDQLEMVAENTPPKTRALAERFWPGALTLVVQKANGLPDRLTAGRPTVAVRMPGHPVPIELINRLGSPITGTSANISGGADLLTLDELSSQLGEPVDLIVEKGPTPKGTASTIVDITSGKPRLLREGAISFQQVLETWETTSD